jgi:glycosyltransferase involved in cell wall biosynthesis
MDTQTDVRNIMTEAQNKTGGYGVPRAERPNWLCVAYAFAPINRSGTYRTLGFVKHLDQLGWDATVLTVEPRDEPLDSDLMRQVPASTQVIRTGWVNLIEGIKEFFGLDSSAPLEPPTGHAESREAAYARAACHFYDAMHGGWGDLGGDRSLRDWISRLIMTPDSRVGWISPAVSRGMRAIRRRRPKVIYSSSPYMSAHIIALILSRWSRIPWVADFRDPWRGNPFREMGYPSLDFWDSFLERAVLQGAAHIVCNTPTMRDSLCQRLPFVNSKCSTIVNGYDGELFDSIQPRRLAPKEHFVLLHCGEFYGPRSPHAWFAGLRRVLEESPELSESVEVALLGSEYYNRRKLIEIAAETGVAKQVRVLGHRGHSETLSYVAGSDALILAGPAGAGSELQIPNKLFEYLAIRRPIIASVSPDSPTVAVLREAHAEALVCEPDDEIGLSQALKQLIRDRRVDVREPWSGIDKFERRRRAEELAAVFEQVSGVAVPLSTTADERASFERALRQQDERPSRFTSGSGRHQVRTGPSRREGSGEVEHEPVSVIVTVADDLNGLRVMLDSLTKQTRTPDEVVVATGGRKPSNGPLTELVESYPFARLATGKKCNIAEGRNRAIRNARHEIIACIDAGCEAKQDWLEKITAPFNDPTVEVVGGCYNVDGRTWFEQLVGLVTMPGAVRPVDPLHFNPSARSLAFRRAAWQRAHGFPNWLKTAEDTLFDLKLRSLDPPPNYYFAGDAVVNWRPRSTPAAVFRQFFGYARGEAQIGRGRAVHSYHSRRYVTIILWLIAALVSGVQSYVLASLGTMFLALLILLWPHHRQARLARRKMHSGPMYMAGLAIGEWVTLGQWLGFRRGRKDRKEEPDVYIDRLRAYLGSDSADISVPAWSMRAVPLPRTLIISWHWAPTNRASANVMAALFQNAPSSAFRVITRHLPMPPVDARTLCPPIPTEYVDWPLPDDRPVRIWTALADLTTLVKMIRRADRLNDRWGVERVLSVFPHRFSMVGGWLVARRLGVPYVAYMHDLCSEAIITRVRAKKILWRIIDRKLLRHAWMVIVPTEEFAQHYRSRGIRRLWTLPHCLPTGVPPSEPHDEQETLRIIYSGNVYEPHEDAIAAILQATRDLPEVRFTFQSNPHPLLRDQSAAWLSRRQAMENLQEADVFLVALGSRTPYPLEIHGCFPSKITDYLAVGRPILAVVPPGCFVDRFIRETGCGLVVNSLNPTSLREAIERLRDPQLREQMAAAGRRVTEQIEPDYWFSLLRQRLVFGPPHQSSAPPFPAQSEDAEQEIGAKHDLLSSQEPLLLASTVRER